ncbi:hypothetical protein [Mesobacillus thioparans]
MRGKVSIIALMMDRKTGNEKKSVRQWPDDGQKERERKEKCPS